MKEAGLLERLLVKSHSRHSSPTIYFFKINYLDSIMSLKYVQFSNVYASKALLSYQYKLITDKTVTREIFQ